MEHSLFPVCFHPFVTRQKFHFINMIAFCSVSHLRPLFLLYNDHIKPNHNMFFETCNKWVPSIPNWYIKYTPSVSKYLTSILKWMEYILVIQLTASHRCSNIAGWYFMEEQKIEGGFPVESMWIFEK
jgi:hypothetical protein